MSFSAWRRVIVLSAFMLIELSASAQVIWYEDFETEADGAQTGSATGAAAVLTWQIPTGNAAQASKQTHISNWRGIQINQTGTTEVVWTSRSINISGYPEVAIEMQLGWAGAGAADYVRCYYKVNGGPEVQFGQQVGQTGANLSNVASVLISGTTVEIIVRGRENTAGNYSGGEPNAMGFDNVTVTAIQTLYSRASGNWGTSGTWSTVGLGGANCNCTPSDETHVVIGNGNTVSITGPSDVINVTVRNTGTLRWMAAAELNIIRGGDISVETGGSLNRNGNTAQIDFDWANVVSNISVASGTTFSVSSFEVNAASTVNLSGAGTIAIADDIIVQAAATVASTVSGSVTIADDFLINAAATVSHSGTGAFTITDDLNFNGDNAAFTNSRTMSIGDIVVANNDDDGNSLTNASTGTLNVGSITANNGNFTITNNGTINQSGNFGANTTLDTGSSFVNAATGTWNWNYVGAAADTDINTVLNCSAAGNTFNYGAAGNQTIIATSYQHLKISTSGIKSISAVLDVNGDLTIQNAAVLNSNSQNLTLAGNWSAVNAASFTEGTALVTLDGSSNQSIANAAGETFGRLTINKSGGSVTLTNSVTIAGDGGTGVDLTLTQGVVNSGTAAPLIINAGQTTNGGTANSFVDGPIRKIGNENFVFPTGDGTRWARIGIASMTGATTQFTAQYFATANATLTTDATLNHVSAAEYWTLDRAVTTSPATVTLYWQGSFSQITNFADLRVARYNGSKWISEGNASTSGAVGGPGTITSNSVTSFSPFSFGSAGGTNPLPVELAYFNALLRDNKVALSWQTTSELNNHFFTIERAVDINNFSVIADSIPGSGTTQLPQSYRFIDEHPVSGRSYYRLKQTDYDGEFSYSKLKTIDFNGPSEAKFSAYASPGNGESVIVEINGFPYTGNIDVTITDLNGKRVCNRSLTVDNSGHGKLEIFFRPRLRSGVYLVRLSGDMLSGRFIVN